MKKIRGFQRWKVQLLLVFVLSILAVFVPKQEVHAQLDKTTGYFYVNINGADGVNSRVKIRADYPSKEDLNSQSVTLTIVDSDSKNNHGLYFVNGENEAVKTIQIETKQGNTSDPAKMDTNKPESFVHSDGTIRYKERAHTVLADIKFQYWKEACTYETGTATVSTGTERINAEKYKWDNSGTSTLEHKVYHNAYKDTFSLQVNESNTGVRAGSSITCNGEYTITLKHPKLEITYLGNGATSGNSGTTQTIFYNKSINPLNVKGKTLNLSRTGYKPVSGAEWNTEKEGNGRSFNEAKEYNAITYKDFSDGEVFKKQTMKLYAQWTADTESSYEIRLHSNIPTGIVNSWYVANTWTLSGQTEASKGETYGIGGLGGSAFGNGYIYKKYNRKSSYSMTQSTNISFPAGYHIVTGSGTKAGWWTTPYGDDGVYINIDGGTDGKITGESLYQYAKDGVVNLYARWAGNSHVLTFNANGGAVGQGSVPLIYGTSNYYDVSWNKPIREGYIFLGWYTALEGGTAVYNEQGFCTNEGTYWSNNMCVYDGDYTVYAHWRPNQYTVIFDPNGGAEVNHIDSIVAKYGESITLPYAKGAYAKYTLDGVNITQDVISGVIVLRADGTVIKQGEEEAERITKGAEIADTKPQADKKAYESVFLGWAMEERKEEIQPKWTAGTEVQVSDLAAEAGVTYVDGAEITLYAVWDDCPWIMATNLYYTLEQAQSGFITVDEILRHQTAYDREDGSPIEPGTHRDDTSFTIPDYAPTDFTQFKKDGSATEKLTVVDSAGSIYKKQIWVHIVDTTATTIKPMGTTRFINEHYYNEPYELGGLHEKSIWKTAPDYVSTIQEGFNCMKNHTPEVSYYITNEIKEQIRGYVSVHGYGNSQEQDAMQNVYNQFMEPSKIQ